MNFLDENIVANQRERLHSWHIPIRHVGYDIRKQGLLDDAIIPFLYELRRPTFFTRDLDFYYFCLLAFRSQLSDQPLQSQLVTCRAEPDHLPHARGMITTDKCEFIGRTQTHASV